MTKPYASIFSTEQYQTTKRRRNGLATAAAALAPDQSLPSYQKMLGISATGRVTPDVAYDANPSTGFWCSIADRRR